MREWGALEWTIIVARQPRSDVIAEGVMRLVLNRYGGVSALSVSRYRNFSAPETTMRLPLLFSLAIFIACAHCTIAAEGQPNVLFIMVDDLRPEAASYGGAAITPNMDKLAARGVQFERAYCNVPVCGASRASLLTGIRPGRHRFLHYHSSVRKDAPGAEVLPGSFKKAGYRTISYGKVFHHQGDQREVWDVIKNPNGISSWRDYLLPENIARDEAKGQRGPAFEIYEGADAYRDERIADLTIASLRKASESNEPFFMVTGFVKPHLPFNAPKQYWDLYDRDAIEIPVPYKRHADFPEAAYHRSGELRGGYSGISDDILLPETEAKQLIHGYLAATSYVDAQIGRVLNELDALGLRDNSVVILLGDHGYNLGEHSLWCKHCNFDHALRVPLLIDAPGYTSDAKCEALVEFVDIYPTLLELTDVPGPAEQLQGVSLVPLLKNPGLPGNEFIIAKYQDGISLRTDRFLYTEWQEKADGEIYARTLFDLQQDPNETDNLANDPAYAEQMAGLQKVLHQNWGKNFETKP